MKKLIFTVCFLAGSSFASAAATQVGPWAQYGIGTETSGAPWVTCSVSPGSALIKNGAGEVIYKDIVVTQTELVSLIRSSSQAPYETLALHIMATDPAHVITAGINPQVPAFMVYRDASSVQGRTGADAAKLVQLMNAVCGPLEPK